MAKQFIDIFNGDADGICALVQLRRENPQPAELITGIKRDINLLKRVEDGEEKHLTVLDVSFEKNEKDVKRLLEQGATIDYFDHHKTGELVSHERLKVNINLSKDTCTSLIVDKKLQGRYRAWAITGAFGDNLINQAQALGLESGFSESELSLLQQLGTYLNYNGYGSSLEDLFFDPKILYKKIQPFNSPFDFLNKDTATFNILATGYQQDMNKADQMPPILSTNDVAIILLPNEQWARRVSGVFGNDLANKFPNRAHAIVTEKNNDHYLVSIRAPINKKNGADQLASQFPSGGGRKAAAGINDLPKDQLEIFIATMQSQFKVNG
jgi:hypothetical protein